MDVLLGFIIAAFALAGSPGPAPLVTALAGTYFLYLAHGIATAPPLSETTGQRAPPSFVAGVLLSLGHEPHRQPDVRGPADRVRRCGAAALTA